MNTEEHEKGIDSISRSINHMNDKVDRIKKLKTKLTHISDYADVHIRNPVDSYEINVTIESEDVTSEIIWVAELNKYMESASYGKTEIPYIPEEDIYKVTKTFTTSRT